MSQQQIILVTGATSGIGRHAALHLARRGHHVIGTGRRVAALQSLEAEAKAAGLRVDGVAMDVTSATSIEEARKQVMELTSGHGVDAIVNNAGYGLVAPLELVTDADLRAQFETNVFGVHAVTRAFLAPMRERGRGRIVNVSSVGGRMVFPFGGAYHATKYAVEAMSDALRMELAPFGIGVSVIEPGYIQTEFTARTMEGLDPYRRADSPYAPLLRRADALEKGIERFAASPAAVARAIEKAIFSRAPRARYVAPWINALGPVIVGLLPTRLVDWAMRVAVGLTRRTLALGPGAAT